MYQLNVPGIYQEIEGRSLSKMRKVMYIGTFLAAIAYIAAGIFGYIAFADGSTTDELNDYFSDNILAAPFKTKGGNTPVVIYVSLFGMMLVVFIATPFCILPAKDSIEEVRNKKFTTRDNAMWTIILCWVSCAFACIFQSITLPI